VEALLSDPNREIICVTLMTFNAKAKSFHVAVLGNFPAARDFAEPDTYMTTRRRAVGNRFSSEELSESSAESSPQSSNDQRTIYRSPRHRVNDLPKPRVIRRASHCHGATNDPTCASRQKATARTLRRTEPTAYAL